MQFEVLQKWSGDPCLPLNYTWEWVECSSDTIPRVTALSVAFSPKFIDSKKPVLCVFKCQITLKSYLN